MSTFFTHATKSQEYYVSILKRLYPEIEIQEVEKRNGYDSIVLIVNKDRLFKIPQREEVIQDYLLEERIFPILLKNCTFQVPNIIWRRQSGTHFDDYIVEYEIMKGNHLTLEIEKYHFSPEILLHIGKQIGQCLAEIHGLDIEPLQQLGVPGYDSEKWHKEYAFVRENCLSFWNKDQIKWVENHYENFLRIWELQTFEPCFIHGDFGNWHIFSDKEIITGIIDWGVMKIDDPAYDIKWHESKNEYDGIISEGLFHEYKKQHSIDPYFFERTEFYAKKGVVWKFIKGVQCNDVQRIEDGYKLLNKAMNNL